MHFSLLVASIAALAVAAPVPVPADTTTVAVVASTPQQVSYPSYSHYNAVSFSPYKWYPGIPTPAPTDGKGVEARQFVPLSFFFVFFRRWMRLFVVGLVLVLVLVLVLI
jgi:hypothetical protein